MNTDGDGSSNPGTDRPERSRGLQTGVRTLIVLVACCAAILWAWRHWSENSDPVRAEARSIQERAIDMLRSGKPAERIAAITELARLGFGDKTIAVPPLLRALEDPEIDVRIAAYEGLRSIGAKAMKSGTVREAARAAVTAQIRHLTDPEPKARVNAASALGWIDSNIAESGSDGDTVRDAAAALIPCLEDPDPGVRSAAVTSLASVVSPGLAGTATPPFDREAVMGALLARLGNHDAGVRRRVINTLNWNPGTSGPPRWLAEALKDESAENRAAAIWSLIAYSRGLDPWVSVLLRLVEHDPDPSVRIACFNTFRRAFRPPAITAAAVPALVASLRSGDAKVRSEAATLLGALKADAASAIPELLRVLNEPLVPGVGPIFGPDMTLDPACAAAWALGRIAAGSVEAKNVMTALMEVARSGPVSRRGWAAYGLGEFGPAAVEAVPILVKLIKESTPDQQNENEAAAVEALGKIAPGTPSADQAIAGLLPVLNSKLPSLAMEALSRFGPKAAAAIPRLRALKDDRDRAVSNAAAKSLLAIEKASPP
jgi:HEAT repeat protein